ncbi:heavy metal translocating P-type ATPase [Methanobrevibacter oralis]|uniref:heavy metal translocating P-type ATPase n=1 Tax=Methanobrevibacter oralis TaxID=66851 RepID=UPI0021C3EFBF|nr:HAD-IC family P-type ATPase [Methanobrevibacter oralis]
MPGETIASDGVILNGETSINQATITGESLPLNKTKGDEVYSGTINEYGSFTMKTTKKSKDSSFQRLVKLIESSKPENAKIVKTADKWATWIVIIAFTASILTFIVTGEITRSVTILVVFCPCALVLATPVAIMAAIGNLTKYGILVKDGNSFEELSKVKELIFDKTGTLTHGTPKIVKIISDDEEEMMELLTSVESKSEHPIAKSIVKYSENKDLKEVSNFKIDVGKGITGMIDGDEICAGNLKYLKEKTLHQNLLMKMI